MRETRLIREAISALGLDLTGLCVLTEAASGSYASTPLIAALAGAEQVLCFTWDSPYAPAEQVIRDTLDWASTLGVTRKIAIYTERRTDVIEKADILTNTGFVRPIDGEMIAHLKPTAVIPLMWETWELREEELDLAACWAHGIPVLGTNERAAGLETFRYVGLIALKLALNLGIEVFRSRILVYSSGGFAESIIRALSDNGAEVFLVGEDCSGGGLNDCRMRRVDGGWRPSRSAIRNPSSMGAGPLARYWLSEGLGSEAVRAILPTVDLLVIAEHRSRHRLIGQGGQITPEHLYALNPSICLAHICGNVQEAGLKKAQCLPQRLAPPGYMSLSTAYVGPRPVIELHAAGLKVGEIMARCRLQGMSFAETLQVATAHPLCQDFSQEQKHRYGAPA